MAEADGGARIAAAFEAARSEGRAALMPYMMGGFPDHASSLAIAAAYADAGADLAEVGVPFSDPLADGPVIHAAATQALRNGGSLEGALEAVGQLGEGVPAVVMCYANMVLAIGPERFAGRLAAAGAAGAIVPDLPFEEAVEVREALAQHGIAAVPLVAPTTPPQRLREICAVAEGFVYVVANVGTTGERDRLPTGLGDLVAAVRAEASVPAAVGFGIGTPEQAAEAGALADGVIVGSRLVRVAGEAGEAEDAAAAVAEFIRAARAAMAG